MIERIAFDVEFVDLIPATLEPRTVYISTVWNTAQHLCACGCGEPVVTPITPDDWKFTYDGRGITLDPSIGNWSYKCQSHYWIKRGEVVWAPQWTPEEIRKARAEENMRLRRSGSHVATDIAGTVESSARRTKATQSREMSIPPLVARVLRLFRLREEPRR